MIVDLNVVDYEDAYKLQTEMVMRRIVGEIGDSLIIAEHFPVFTLGRLGKIENLLVAGESLARAGVKVLRVDRGGDITFHGPGQIVAYPIIDLRDKGMDLHGYLRTLEGVVIDLLRDYSIAATRIDGRTGVWVNGGKIASIGIAVRRWVTYHGLSLNVHVDPAFFSMINPCGFRDVRAINLKDVVSGALEIEEVKKGLIHHLEREFNLERMHDNSFSSAVMA